MKLDDTPSRLPLSASTSLTVQRKDDQMAYDIQFIQYMLRAKGEKCGQCRHNIIVDHTNGRCDLCDCVRVRRVNRPKRGMQLSELLDIEGMADRKQNYIAADCPECKSSLVYRKGFESRPLMGPRAQWQCRNCGNRWRSEA